jgi:hypothetical protein
MTRAPMIMMTSSMTATTTTEGSRSDRHSDTPECLPIGRGLHLLLSAGVVFALGCARPAPMIAPKPEPTRTRYALADYLPPTGLRLAVHLRPEALFADSDVGSALRTLLPTERLTAFRQVTGVDLPALEEVWIANYELGTLFLAPYAHAEDAGKVFLAHSESHTPERTWAKGLTSYSVVRSQVPHSLVLEASAFTALAEKDPELGRLVILRALGKLTRFPSAVARSGFENFPRVSEALATLYWTGPTPGQGLDTEPSDFTAGVEVGRLSLSRCPEGIQAQVWVRGALGEEPETAWRSYLTELADRPEFRAVFGQEFALTALSCQGSGPDLSACEVRVLVDAHALLTRFGRLLRGALDSF